MYFLGYKVKRVTKVREWLSNTIQLTIEGNGKEFKSMKPDELNELLNKLGLSCKEELVGMEMLERRCEGGKFERAFLPKGSKITLAAKGENGELTQLVFE